VPTGAEIHVTEPRPTGPAQPAPASPQPAQTPAPATDAIPAWPAAAAAPTATVATAAAPNFPAAPSADSPRAPRPSRDRIDDVIDARQTAEAVLYEIRRVIVGQDAMLERVLVALLAGGHLLLEGVPGLAKTLTIKTLADVLHASFRRIQFTPDLVPGDLIGTRIYRPDRGTFDTELGPVFANFLLADEINRAPAKVQSALLEVMQERQVTIGHESHPVPRPFLVMATQNPIESEGTYPLPEAQVDRFMMKVVVGYPNAEEEALVVERSLRPAAILRPILTAESLAVLQALTAEVYVDRPIVDYAVALTSATRFPERVGLPNIKPYIAFGASPRGSINLVHAARALALVRGRRYVVPGDVVDLARDVLRHRVVPSFAALAEEVNADMILDRLVSAVPVPRVAQDSLLARAEAAERGSLARRADTAPVADYTVGAGSAFAPSAPARPADDLEVSA
jgi:MoxR-like ATPase